MNLDLLNDVELDPKLKASINYAKARASIEASAKSRKEKREAKEVVITYLNGVHIPGKSPKVGQNLDEFGNVCIPSSVKFPDNSIAKF